MTSENVSPIGANLARYRKAEGLSAADLSEIAGEGLSRSVIANLENGRKDDITVKQLMALANALRVPPSFIVADMFNPGAPSYYPLPDYKVPTFSSTSFKMDELDVIHINANLFYYFRGILFLHDASTGAAKLVAELNTALEGRGAAWSRFTRLATRFAELKNGAELEYSTEEIGFDIAVLNAASEIIRWDKILTGLGVDTGNGERNVSQALKGLRLPFTEGEIEAYKISQDPFPPQFDG